jgi:S1-C subfamily serine protease
VTYGAPPTRRTAANRATWSTRMRVFAAAVAALMVAAVSGCGVIHRARDIVTSAVQPSPQPPILPVEAPDANLANSPEVAATRGSVVKVRGTAPSCQKILEGSGFVVAPHRVMSMAHVVAGTDSVSVELDGTTFDAQVVSYDPNADVSLLDVPNLTAQPLTFAESPATSGTDALLLAYPNASSFVATPARIREIIKLVGPDIYRSTRVTREVYLIRGTVKQGDSGGPLIDPTGRVLGLAYGAAVDDPDTGFVLTANEIAPQLAKIGNTAPVATGACIGP